MSVSNSCWFAYQAYCIVLRRILMASSILKIRLAASANPCRALIFLGMLFTSSLASLCFGRALAQSVKQKHSQNQKLRADCIQKVYFRYLQTSNTCHLLTTKDMFSFSILSNYNITNQLKSLEEKKYIVQLYCQIHQISQFYVIYLIIVQE